MLREKYRQRDDRRARDACHGDVCRYYAVLVHAFLFEMVMQRRHEQHTLLRSLNEITCTITDSALATYIIPIIAADSPRPRKH